MEEGVRDDEEIKEYGGSRPLSAVRGSRVPKIVAETSAIAETVATRLAAASQVEACRRNESADGIDSKPACVGHPDRVSGRRCDDRGADRCRFIEADRERSDGHP